MYCRSPRSPGQLSTREEQDTPEVNPHLVLCDPPVGRLGVSKERELRPGTSGTQQAPTGELDQEIQHLLEMSQLSLTGQFSNYINSKSPQTIT